MIRNWTTEVKKTAAKPKQKHIILYERWTGKEKRRIRRSWAWSRNNKCISTWNETINMMRTTTISAFFYVSVCCHILSSSNQKASLALSVVHIVVAFRWHCALLYMLPTWLPNADGTWRRTFCFSLSFACSLAAITFCSHSFDIVCCLQKE